MASNIILKNKANVDVVFVPRNTAGNVVTYVAPGATLLGAMRLDLNLKEGGLTNRVVGKLSVPTVGVNPTTGVNGVQWTEVGSFDLSSVKSATTVAAEDFFAMWKSLAGHAAVEAMFRDGVRT